jgi:hypothetical protein
MPGGITFGHRLIPSQERQQEQDHGQHERQYLAGALERTPVPPGDGRSDDRNGRHIQDVDAPPLPGFGPQGPPLNIRGSQTAISGNITTMSSPVSCISMNGQSARKMSCKEISGGATLFR